MMPLPLPLSRSVVPLLTVMMVGACAAPAPAGWSSTANATGAANTLAASLTRGTASATGEQVLRGRHLVIAHGCGDCHGGGSDPAAEGWLAGRSTEEEVFEMGPYRVWSRNLTSDAETGLGRYADRQLFNSLRYGLRPSETPDIEITSAAPGVGNHPVQPNYLAPVMLWTSFRHMSDRELWDIIAYLRHLRPVRNATPEGVRPADFWAGDYAVEKIGDPLLAAFPTANEELRDPSRRGQVLLGRAIVVTMGCGDCHGGRANPAGDRWLNGFIPAEQRLNPGPYEIEFPIGPFTTFPRNLTPDNATGLGRFSERQIFNSLRFGLRPGETADIEITSSVPGEGNHPVNPKYLAPPMPWPAWRHLSDSELWAVAAYVKNGLRAVRNRVPDSEGPPDFWAGAYTPQEIGTFPAPVFPTLNEKRLQ